MVVPRRPLTIPRRSYISFHRRYHARQRSKLLAKLKLTVLLYRHFCERKRIWVHPILMRRNEQGEYHRLVRELRLERVAYYQKYFRMSPEMFDSLLHLVASKITKQATVMREPIPPEERLAVTLRFLATGDSYQSIGGSYRIDPSTLCSIIPQVCSSIWTVLQPIFMPKPDQKMWKSISEGFKSIWHFPNCVGSIDGKHIVIQAPPNSGSAFFNYKKSFSVVLLAVVDASYKFVVVDIGAFGRQSDAGVFSNSNFGKCLIEGNLDLPSNQPLTPGGVAYPHIFVGDEAFPLKQCLMRPYSGTMLPNDKRIFNYRLSRARRTVENAFGIMASRFRIFRRVTSLKPTNVDCVVKACTVLHNFLASHPTHLPADENLVLSEESAMRSLSRVGRPSPAIAQRIRDSFKDYFVGEGALPWQQQTVSRTC